MVELWEKKDKLVFDKKISIISIKFLKFHKAFFELNIYGQTQTIVKHASNIQVKEQQCLYTHALNKQQ